MLILQHFGWKLHNLFVFLYSFIWKYVAWQLISNVLIVFASFLASFQSFIIFVISFDVVYFSVFCPTTAYAVHGTCMCKCVASLPLCLVYFTLRYAMLFQPFQNINRFVQDIALKVDETKPCAVAPRIYISYETYLDLHTPIEHLRIPLFASLSLCR